VLYLRGFVGAEEEDVKWWVPNNFIGTKVRPNVSTCSWHALPQ
jgi:hypothetical protein